MSKKKTSERPKDRGRAQAKLVPFANPNKKFLGRLRGIIKIVGDIESPVEPPEAWEVAVCAGEGTRCHTP